MSIWDGGSHNLLCGPGVICVRMGNGEWGSPRIEALIYKHRDPLLPKCNTNSICKCSYYHIYTYSYFTPSPTSLPPPSPSPTSNTAHSTAGQCRPWTSITVVAQLWATSTHQTQVWMCWWQCVSVRSCWCCGRSWANVVSPLQSPSLTVLRWKSLVCLRWRWTFLCSPTEGRVWHNMQWVHSCMLWSPMSELVYLVDSACVYLCI